MNHLWSAAVIATNNYLAIPVSNLTLNHNHHTQAFLAHHEKLKPMKTTANQTAGKLQFQEIKAKFKNWASEKQIQRNNQ